MALKEGSGGAALGWPHSKVSNRKLPNITMNGFIIFDGTFVQVEHVPPNSAPTT